MRGSLGLVIGVIVGAGGMYLALRPPWGGGGAAAPADAGVAVAAPDAGVPGKGQPRPKRRPAGRSGGAPGGTVAAEGEAEPEVRSLTAAERALEWRGDPVALPPRTVDMGAGGAEARSLDDAEIGATLGAQADGVRACVVDAATGTDLRAAIAVELLVDGAGRVTRSRMQAPRYLFDRGLLACARRALARVRFPATGAPTKVTFPVNLG